MNDKSEKVLEFDKIKKLLSQEAVSPMAKKSTEEIEPLTDDFLIRDLLKETDEAAAVVLFCRSSSFRRSPRCEAEREIRGKRRCSYDEAAAGYQVEPSGGCTGKEFYPGKCFGGTAGGQGTADCHGTGRDAQRGTPPVRSHRSLHHF